MQTFKSIEELTEWLNENQLDVEDVEVVVKQPNVITTSTTDGTSAISDTVPTADHCVSSVFETKDISIEVKSLSEQPNYKLLLLSEGADPYIESIWFVDDYESIKDACSTSKISYKGSTLLMNVCESNGVSTVNLILEVDGRVKKMPFKLEKACNNDSNHDMIISL